MVVFNDPVPVDNPPLQGVLMALEMRGAIGALTDRWRRLGHDIGFGIGIAHGFATLGTIGFEGRFDYVAIGTAANVASKRLLGWVMPLPRRSTSTLRRRRTEPRSLAYSRCGLSPTPWKSSKNWTNTGS